MDKTTYPVRSRAREKIDLVFNFAPNGSSAVDQTTIVGRGVTSVTRTGAGVFQILLDQSYNQLLAAHATVQLNTAAATFVVFSGAHTLTASGRTITITVFTESAGTFAAADIAANANNRVYVTLALGNTGRP